MNQIVLIVVLPLLAAFLVPIVARMSASLGAALGPLVMGVCLWITGTVAIESAGNAFAINIGGFMPPLGISFYVDRLALLFAFLTALMVLLLWPFQGEHRPREHALTLILAAASGGLALSGDLFNIYVFYELVSVASFGLVATGNRSAAPAVRYLILSGFGSVLALVGIALIYTQTGTLNLAHLSQLAPTELANPTGLAAFALILLGVGVKAELFPVNTWVPEVYASAPSRVSALLAGLVSKLAVVVILRLLVLVFAEEQALLVMLLLGLLGVITGELAAWRAQDMNRMLAYSSIGQLGMVFVAFSIPGETGVIAGLAIALHHLVVKPALFLLAARWGGALQGLSGAAHGSLPAALLFTLFALSLVGVPPLPGFWAKLLLVMGLAEQASPLYQFALAGILIATVVEANYLFRIVSTLFRRDQPASLAIEKHSGTDLTTSAIFGVGLIAAVLLLTPLSQSLKTIAQQTSNADAYRAVVTLAPTSAAPIWRPEAISGDTP